MLIQNNIHGVTHPLIKEAHFKKEITQDHKELDILIIDMIHGNTHRQEATNSNYADLLMDLPDLYHQAEEKFGHIDRIDIRTH